MLVKGDQGFIDLGIDVERYNRHDIFEPLGHIYGDHKIALEKGQFRKADALLDYAEHYYSIHVVSEHFRRYDKMSEDELANMLARRNPSGIRTYLPPHKRKHGSCGYVKRLRTRLT